MEHTVAFVGRLVVDIALVGRMVECRIGVAQVDCHVRVPKHIVGEIVAIMMVPYFELVDFNLCKWVEFLLEKLIV